MSFNFPNSPTEGQTYEAIPGGITFVYQNGRWLVRMDPNASYVTDAPNDGQSYGRKSGLWVDVTEEAPADSGMYARKNGAWTQVVGGASISDTAPTTPLNGQLWWNSTSGNLYISYNDGDTTQWVQINGST